MRKIFYIVSVMSLLLMSTDLLAQINYRFYNINQANGLNSNVITAITEDGDGFIWVGTQTGLLRYDGSSFLSINDINDSLNLEGCYVTVLKTSRNGDVWIGTDHGASRYNIKAERLTNYILDSDGANAKVSYRTENIFVNHDGRVFLFVSDGFLYVYNEQSDDFEPFAYDFFSHKKIKYCFLDKEDKIWAIDHNATSLYCVDFKGSMLDSLECNSKYPFPFNEAYSFINNGDGTYWLGSTAGIYQIDYKQKTITLVEDIAGQPLPKNIKAFYQRQNGDIWIGTNAEELFIVNRERKTVQIIESDHSQQSTRRLNSVTVNTIYEDSQGITWLGTWHGLSYTSLSNPIKFNAISYPENSSILLQNQISAVCQSPDGTIAIGSDGGGIVFWDGVSNKKSGSFSSDSPNSKMGSASILAMAYDKDGNLWTGGYNNPLHRLSADHKSSEAFSLVNNIKGAISDFITDILIDRYNRMWVLTNGYGLLKFNPKTKKFTQIVCDSRLVEPVSMYGTCLEEGPDSTILVGTYGGMYVYYPNQDIIENYSYSYGSPYSISHNVVHDILQDSHHRVWVATPAGIDRFDIRRGIFTHYNGDNAIQNMICTNIIEDVSHEIWITTNNGLLKFNPEVNKVTRLYDTDDGLLSNSFEKHSSMVDKKGTIFIGTHDGLVFFNPYNIKSVTNVPKPIITSFLLNYNRTYPSPEGSILTQSIANTNEIDLSWKDVSFSIEFTVLDYIYGNNINFLYKLEGYQNAWTNIGSRREVGFTNLNPGRYTLRLLAENSDRCRSEERTLIINIRPPWYRTKVAIALFISLCVLLFWLIHVFRVHRMRRRQMELEEQVESRTIELMSLNSMLEQRNEEMKQQKEEIQSQRDELFEKNNQLHTSREAIQQSYQRLLDLSELDKQISESSDIESILQKVYHNKVVPLAGCGLCICKRSKQQNVVEFSPYIENNATFELPDEKIYELMDPLSAACFNEKRDILADNGSDYDMAPFLLEMGYRTALRLPLFNGNEVAAIMIINSPKENAFSKNDIAIFKVIASYSEIVIEKADAYSMLASKNSAINGSISYAKTIQKLFLPQIEDFQQYFDAAVIERPKDIVSGDYIWQTVVKHNQELMIFCAVVDCTGHGVPGAFMSLISNQILRDVVLNMKLYEPKDILTTVSEVTSSVLKQDNGENKDGMDMSLCRFDVDADGTMKQIVYSGAKSAILYKAHNSNECAMIPADRISIAGGYCRNSEDRPLFTQKVLNAVPGTVVYMYSDGIIDQNNTARARFGRKRLIECVNSVSSESPEYQKQRIERTLDIFSESTDQRDDITFLILKIKEKIELPKVD